MSEPVKYPLELVLNNVSNQFIKVAKEIEFFQQKMIESLGIPAPLLYSSQSREKVLHEQLGERVREILQKETRRKRQLRDLGFDV